MTTILDARRVYVGTQRAQAAYLGAHRLAHIRTNLYAKGLVRDRVGINASNGTVAPGAANTRSFVMQVQPGEAYNIGRTAVRSSRFRWVFYASEPTVAGQVPISGSWSAVTDTWSESGPLTVPPGAYWMLVYVNANTIPEPIPDLVIERGDTVGSWFDGDSPNAEWTGTPNASPSTLWAAD